MPEQRLAWPNVVCSKRCVCVCVCVVFEGGEGGAWSYRVLVGFLQGLQKGFVRILQRSYNMRVLQGCPLLSQYLRCSGFLHIVSMALWRSLRISEGCVGIMGFVEP